MQSERPFSRNAERFFSHSSSLLESRMLFTSGREKEGSLAKANATILALTLYPLGFVALCLQMRRDHYFPYSWDFGGSKPRDDLVCGIFRYQGGRHRDGGEAPVPFASTASAPIRRKPLGPRRSALPR